MINIIYVPSYMQYHHNMADSCGVGDLYLWVKLNGLDELCL